MEDFARSFDFKTVSYDGRLVQVPVSRYRYEELNGVQPHIRLLRFLESNHTHDTLLFRLENYKLSEAVPYVALSYRWGDPSQCAVIHVDDVPFAVTSNLYDALQHLRQPGLAVWVDAICIDQSNEPEKGSQVPLIKSIYQYAALTWVWLGHTADGSEKVMRLLNAIAKRRVPPKENFRKLRPALYGFFRRKYWERVWIIQEITVSGGVLFIWGNDTVWWKGIEQFLTLVSDDPDLLFGGFPMVDHLRLIKRSYKLSKPLGLLQVLSWSSATQATDLRDKVFALFGLCSDAVHFTLTP